MWYFAFSKYLKNPVIQKKLATKLGQEGLEKLLAKSGVAAAKNIAVGPGTLYSFVEGLARISPLFGGSDPTGMLLSFGSAIPFAGWGVIVTDILRDIDREAFDAHILPNLFTGISEENFADFFTQALGLDANQFERGTPNISSKMLGGVDSISEILSVTKAFGEATGFGAEVAGLIGEAGLSSYPVASGSYTFDASGDIGGGGAVNASVKEAELKKREKYKKEEDDDDDDEGEVKTKSTKKRGSGVGGGVLGSVISQSGMLAHHTSSYAGVKIDASGEPGVVLGENLEIGCKEKSLKIVEIQREGKKAQKSGEFLLGSKIIKGSNLNNV